MPDNERAVIQGVGGSLASSTSDNLHSVDYGARGLRFERDYARAKILQCLPFWVF